MIRPMKSGSQARRISSRFQKRNACAFGSAVPRRLECRNEKTGRGVSTERPRRVPAAVTRSAQAPTMCLSLLGDGHAPFSKTATVALLVSHYNRTTREGSHERAVLQKRNRCAFAEHATDTASQIPLADGHSQKRNRCAFAAETKSAAVALLKINPLRASAPPRENPGNPKTQPLRFCRRPAA